MTTKRRLFSKKNMVRYSLEFGVVFVGVWLSLVASRLSSGLGKSAGF